MQEYRKYIEQIYEEILRTQGVVSAEIIKNRVTKQFVVPTHLLQMGEIERERLRVRSKEINSISTYRSSQYYQKYLADYLTSMRSINLKIRWYRPNGTMSSGDSSPSGFSQQKSLYVYSGSNTETLQGWGNKTKGHWGKGTYRIEFCTKMFV